MKETLIRAYYATLQEKSSVEEVIMYSNALANMLGKNEISGSHYTHNYYINILRRLMPQVKDERTLREELSQAVGTMLIDALDDAFDSDACLSPESAEEILNAVSELVPYSSQWHRRAVRERLVDIAQEYGIDLLEVEKKHARRR